MGKFKPKAKSKSKEKQSSSIAKDNENSITNVEETNAFSKIQAGAEILLEVVSRLPPKDIFKIKSVSKGIHNLTTKPEFAAKHFLNCKALSANLTGFFCQFVDSEYFYDPEFIPIEPDADRLPDTPLNFLKDGKNNSYDVVKVFDSCNGLLLCCIYTGKKKVKTYLVCNPLTKECVALPFHNKRSNKFYYALLAETTYAGYFTYKVVCVLTPKDNDSCSILLVFSSETGEWKEFEEISLPALCYESMMGSKVVLNSKLFWDCLEGHILVCHLNKNGASQRCYELIQSPRAPLGRSLWKSKDKLFCYCQGFDNEFPVWSLSLNNEKELEWKVEGCKEFEMLNEDLSKEFASGLTQATKGPKPRVGFKIIGFKPESNLIYLWKPDLIIKYDFTERDLEILWGYGGAPLPSRILPYVHSFAKMSEKSNSYVDVERNKRKTRCTASRSQ
uniref:Uncharacterized protein n=1 Tax=Fagus sylvatica TaxID=28930 RepID=A0A2N9FQ77_FAGSY